MLIRGEISNGIAIIVACFPQENQSGILERLLEERHKRGGKIDQQSATRLAKMVAENQKCLPLRAKRGRKKILGHADAVMNNVSAKMRLLTGALEEMFSASKSTGGLDSFFKQLKAGHPLDVERCFKDMESLLKKCVASISVVA